VQRRILTSHVFLYCVKKACISVVWYSDTLVTISGITDGMEESRTAPPWQVKLKKRAPT